MKLSRNQKRWLRQHKSLVTALKVLLFALVLLMIYMGFNAITGKNKKTDSSKSQKDSQSNSKYVSQMIVLNDKKTLSDIEMAALSYVPDPKEKKPYMIRVNRVANCVTVYGKDASGFYTIPVKAMACSTGKSIGDTPTGSGEVTDKYTFHLMVDGTYAQYSVRFMSGGILFHSVPYLAKEKNQLEADQFNLLGSVASLGCVRLCVRDAMWIYDNCPKGTPTEVYDDPANPGPLGKPEMIKIPLESPNAGWDPTDPDPMNPWNQCMPRIDGAVDVTVNVGDMYNPRMNVTAVDTCGNDITRNIMLSGSYDLGVPGCYTVTYTVEDLIGKTASATIRINVIDSSKK